MTGEGGRDAARHVEVGVVGAPHGVRGEVRIKSFMSVPTALAGCSVRTSRGGAVLRIVAARAVKDDMVVARIEGVTTREAAAALTGLRLSVSRDSFPPPDEDEFYHADLVGLRVHTADGTPVGTVSAVANYGAGDLLEIDPGEGPSLLVPFLKAFVPVVDLAAGTVVVTAEALAAADDDDGEAAP